MDTTYSSGVIQNTCVCEAWNDDTNEWQESGDCFGCWDEATDDFSFATKSLFDSPNFTGWWKIEGFPTWRGPVGGLFDAKDSDQLLNQITPDRTEWTLVYEVKGETLTGRLSHHDAPTGGQITVTMIPNPEGGES